MSIETRPLRLFLLAAQELHFRRAARRAGLTQPSLSYQIAQLEGQLGVPLFERQSRRVVLTDAGRALLEGGQRVLEDLDRLTEDVRRASGQPRRMVLGYVEYANLPVLPRVLQRLRVSHPEVTLEVRELYTAEMLAALEERSIDAGFGYGEHGRPWLSSKPVVEGRWVAALPPGHRLGRRRSLPLAALAQEPLLLFARRINPLLFDDLVQQCRLAGFEPSIVYQPTQLALGSELVAAGLGTLLMVSYNLRSVPPGVKVIPLAGLDPTHIQIRAFWRNDQSTPALKTFLAALPPQPLRILSVGSRR
ncbi:MAG: LysR substrate-binding domain-containing protein [Polyangiaceae bacterium]|jgi:DNA-binding transcriptional LysR family regulator|nr:LysR substrate-binding domain-containing protein [Polyangiaceae bacterium]